MAKAKTWTELLGEVQEIGRKWGAAIQIENDLDARGRRRGYQTPEEREVRLRLHWFSPTGRRVEIKADVRLATSATENLRLIVVALEMCRLAEVRAVDKVLATLYRQMFPAPAPAPPPPPPAGRQIPPHYAVLHISPAAPLEVAEAAYRTLAKRAHPDAGGDGETMKRLNAAIATIRKEKGG